MSETKAAPIYATFPDDPRHFESMAEAFNFCREKGHPVTVCAEGKILKLYPSGRADDTGRECPKCRMKKQNEKAPTLDDVLNEFVAEYERPTSEALEAWVGRYPQFRRELVDFVAAWAEQTMLPESPDAKGEQP